MKGALMLIIVLYLGALGLAACLMQAICMSVQTGTITPIIAWAIIVSIGCTLLVKYLRMIRGI
jgi:hypothetical protein